MHWCFQKGMKYGAASQLSAGGHSPLLFGALLPARVPESGSRTRILFPRPIPSPGSGVCGHVISRLSKHHIPGPR